MVKWENEKNVYILGAALGALGTTMSNEIIEAIRADWRMLSLHFLLLLHPFVVLFHLIPFRLCPIYTSPYRLMIHNLPLIPCPISSYSELQLTSHPQPHSIRTFRRNTHHPRCERSTQETVHCPILLYYHHYSQEVRCWCQES
jgi:hypothetical protein